MSDTRRKVQPGWGPGNPKWDAAYGDTVHSVKHQQRDRNRNAMQGGRHLPPKREGSKFSHGMGVGVRPRTLRERRRRIEEHDEREALDER